MNLCANQNEYLSVPDLNRGLCQPHEAPVQVRDGVVAKVNTTLTKTRKTPETHNYPILSTVDTP